MRFWFLLFLPLGLSAQLSSSDLDLLEQESSVELSQPDGYNDKSLIETKKKSALARYNPLSLLAKGAMSVYQHAFSPQLGQRCNYEMSCSNFSKHAIEEFGIFKGVYISADRVLRCNRISYSKIHPTKLNMKTGKVRDFPADYRSKKAL